MEQIELGRLLDKIDEAAGSDAEMDALRNALDHAVGLLIEQGNEIPRGDEDGDEE